MPVQGNLNLAVRSSGRALERTRIIPLSRKAIHEAPEPGIEQSESPARRPVSRLPLVDAPGISEIPVAAARGRLSSRLPAATVVFAALAASCAAIMFLAGENFVSGAATGLLLAAGTASMVIAWLVRRERGERMRLVSEIEALEDKTWELRESEERYRSLAEVFGDLVLHRDAKGRVIFANSALMEAFAIEPGTLTGQPFKPQILAQCEVGSSMRAPDGFAARELRIVTAAGPRWFHWIDLPIRDDVTGEAAMRSVARDITGPQAGRAGARTCAHQGGTGEPGQVAVPCERQPRDANAAQRHSWNVGPAARYRADA